MLRRPFLIRKNDNKYVAHADHRNAGSPSIDRYLHLADGTAGYMNNATCRTRVGFTCVCAAAHRSKASPLSNLEMQSVISASLARWRVRTGWKDAFALADVVTGEYRISLALRDILTNES